VADRQDRQDRHDRQDLLDAFGSPVRREILWAVWDCELAAGEIGARFELSAATISEHLATLRRAGLVTMRVDGSFRRYRAVPAALQQLQRIVLGPDTRWRTTDSDPDSTVPTSRTGRAVTVMVVVPADIETTFRAFTDSTLYGRWLGVPVHLEDGQFRCRMEWGTEVRGSYLHVVAPRFIAMSWDFADGTVPLPGDQRLAYLHLAPAPGGCAVTLQQLADDDAQARYFDAAWRLVLGRLATELPAALETVGAPRRRPARRKRST
jgi:uncharacterized protein YndB with AHSA1/START domain/DNA-binding transcriptional ArsR family regulator